MAKFHQIEKDVFRGESIMLSNSTSNSSFLNNVDGHETDDRIQILDCEDDARRTYHEPLSQTRRICFIASIVGTFLVVVVFMLLPCESNCVAKTGFLKTRNWLKNYDKMEIKGEINLVQPPGSIPHDLVFMYRSDKIFPDMNVMKKGRMKYGGIMTLSGTTGDIKWIKDLPSEPRSIDCSLLDCDNSGTKDCLILDEYGQLSCMDISGHLIYSVINSKATKQTRKDLFDFPLILPDLNQDSVPDIMMASTNGKSNTTDLTIISGALGNLILKEVQNCSAVHKLQIDTDFTIKYICIKKEKTEQQMIKNLTDFYSIISKRPLDLKRLQPVSKIPQHKYNGQRATTFIHETVTEIQDKKLTVANSGSWPRESKAVVTLTSKVKGVTTTLYNQTFNKVYVMVPVPLILNSSSSVKGGVDNIHGFVIKMWIWNGTEISYNLENSRIKRSTDKRDLKAQRSNYTNQNFTGSAYKTKVLYLKESIMLIVFNSTDMKTENTSQSNIVQFCQKTVGQKDKKSDIDSVCQPDLSYQENSVLITDIDGDGSKELVSYYSTFINENQGGVVVGDKWKLKTYIQLFKLETELPKLYADLNMV